MDWEAEGLLEGVDGPARASRRRLLDELHADGVGAEELRRAVREDRLALVPIERVLTAGPGRTAAEVAAEAGVDLDRLLAVQRAIGLPAEADERAFGDEDVAAARRIKAYLDAGLPPDELLALMRVVSAGVGRAAEAIRQVVADALIEPAIDEHTLARRYADTARALLPLATADIEFLLRMHLRERVRREAIGLAERRAGVLPATRDVAVAFADLVGFTRLGQKVTSEALGGIADRLEQLAADAARAPVRIVKNLGDGLMLASPEPRPLVEALLDLVEAAERDEDLPELRAGAAWGPAVARYGDWYGATVNLASRLTARARPGAVLADERLREAAGDAFRWSRAGTKRLKGLDEAIPAWRVRRSDPA